MKVRNLLMLGAFALGLMSSCSTSSKKVDENKPVSVDSYYPTMLGGNDVYVSGKVAAKQTAMISTRVMGFIERIYVKPGDRVRRGQLLVTINSSDMAAKRLQAQAMVTEASAAVKNTRKDYERYQTLFSQKSISSKEMENIELNKISMESKLRVARQQLNEINAMMNYLNIRAPFSGLVTQKIVDEGSTANPGMPILAIEQEGDLNVVASVPEAYIQYIHVGSLMDVEIKSLNKELKGVVSELSPSATLSGGEYQMKLSLNDKRDLKSGMFAGISIKIEGAIDNGTELRIMIRQSSVINYDQLTGVYVVGSNHVALIRWIRLGKKVGNQVEVLSGLEQNEQVIDVAKGKLFNGAKITIQK
jgi:RND family efflux transporter MFP subunit